MKIEIATNSVDKINGIKVAFSRYFHIEETEMEVLHRSVESRVPEQPFDEETYLGAKNRVDALIGSNDASFYVSCEAGIESFLGKYFNVQVVCIFDKKSKNYVFGKSAGWQIPSKDIEVIKESDLDSYLRNKGIDALEQILSSSRAEAVAEATEHALASLSFM